MMNKREDAKGELPRSGDTVTWGNGVYNAEVIAVNDFSAWLIDSFGDYRTVEISKLRKPKTPEEELAAELIEKYKHLSPKEQVIAIASDIIRNNINKYNITKKPQ